MIASTNRDLQAAVSDGHFREDLYYRLNVVRIRIPPLRERMEDVPLLAAHFAGLLAIEHGRPAPRVSEAALESLLAHDWPGNARELRNAVERAMVASRAETLTDRDFQFLFADAHGGTWKAPTNLPLSEVEHQVIVAVLKRAGGNVRETARILGIDRSTLYDKLRRYGIPR